MPADRSDDMPDDENEPDEALFSQLSEKLRLTHARVASLDVSDERKQAVVRRLIAITDASKHGLGKASQRIDALIAELDEGLVRDADSTADLENDPVGDPPH